jgi:hypothetical protein
MQADRGPRLDRYLVYGCVDGRVPVLGDQPAQVLAELLAQAVNAGAVGV